MNLLLYGLNFWPELTGVGKYSGEMAQWLAARGHAVRVVTAPPYYPQWQVQPPYRAWRWQHELWPVPSAPAGHAVPPRAAPLLPVQIHRVPLWVPRKARIFNRLLHLLSFALTSIPTLLRALRRRPDVMVLVVPTLFCAPVALLAARVFRVPIWLHVQDFEVDAMYGLGLAGTGRSRWRAAVQRAALALESRLLRGFDRVSSITPPMVQRLQQKGVPSARTREFGNWVDLDAIRPLATPSPYRAEWGLPADAVVCLYAGNMGEKQGLELVIDAARLLAQQPRLHFVLAGDGAARERMQRAASDLPRVRWLPLQPLHRLGDLLGAADVHLLPQRADAADLVMPSKLTGMLASGRAIVGTAAVDTQLGRVLDAVGVRVTPGDAAALAQAVVRLSADAGHRAALGRRARAHAERHIGRDALMLNFETELAALVAEKTVPFAGSAQG